MNAVDSKPFETVVFWTSWLTVTSKRIRIYIRVKTKIYETGKTCQFKEMHQMRLTWSKHHGTHTRNDLKRLFVERCGLQSLKQNADLYSSHNKKLGKSGDLSIWGNASNEFDFEQTSWNPHSKLFEAAVCWTMCLTATQTKVKIHSQN